jgi:hypothetical protein
MQFRQLKSHTYCFADGFIATPHKKLFWKTHNVYLSYLMCMGYEADVDLHGCELLVLISVHLLHMEVPQNLIELRLSNMRVLVAQPLERHGAQGPSQNSQ